MISNLSIIRSILIFSVYFICVTKALKFEDNGYKNLVVAISPDLTEGTDGQTIIDNIKVTIQYQSVLLENPKCWLIILMLCGVCIHNFQEWISSGSENLYTATKKNAYIASVDILIPANWLVGLTIGP